MQPSNAHTTPPTPERESSVFENLHRLAAQPRVAGFYRVRGSHADLAAMADHLQRCGRLNSREVIWVGGESAQPWCEVARQLGVTAVDAALLLAASILDAAEAAMIIVHDRRPSEFGRAVAAAVAELLGAPGSTTQVWWLDECDQVSDIDAHQLGGPLRGDDARQYLHTLVDSQVLSRQAMGWQELQLAQLANWSVALTPGMLATEPPPRTLSSDAHMLLARLTLADRMCPQAWLSKLGVAAAATLLVEAGMIRLERGFVQVLRPLWHADEFDRRAVIDCLKHYGDAAWDRLRAA